jgi:ferredoxin-NADP reductase
VASTRTFPADVVAVHQHALGLFTLEMRPRLGSVPRFKAGQFMHVAIDPYDPSTNWPESRVFSIANAPTRCGALRITYAVKGRFTSRMAEEIKPGGTVWLKMPFGSFHIAPQQGRELVLVAGGTGVTPFISFLEFACDEQTPSSISLFYGVRSPEMFLYTDVIAECRQKLPSFSCHMFAESGTSENPDILRGQLNIELILSKTPEPKSAVYYLSGPPVMIKAFRANLAARGIGQDSIRVDDWD